MFEKLNNTEKNIYKVLVQNAETKLPTPDKDWNGVTFKKEAVEKALPSLKGKMVYDNTISGHALERGQFNNKIFAQVTDTQFDPEGNKAYAYIDVFDKDYVPLMDKLAENYNNNVELNEGFSTETMISDKTINPDNSRELVDYSYTGIVLGKNVRDKTGVEGRVVVNNLINTIIPDDKIGGNPMGNNPTTEPALSTADAMNLVKENSALTERAKTWKDKEKAFEDKIKSLEADLKTKDEEIKTLNNTVSEHKKADEEEKETLTNTILEKYPEDQREAVKKTLESNDLNTLRLMNSIVTKENESGETLNNFAGVTANIPSGIGGSETYGKSAYEQKEKINISKEWDEAIGVDE